MSKIEQEKEFTLPFLGREEELRFLLREYDEMLNAQYRSVWLEAPAGMGKTTLVEEFLKRIDVAHPALAGCATSSLKPWIVHAHLRERSSNSLASFVEALGATLQTLTDEQREKLFSGLTTFYQERTKKIVGGGNVQSMDMEEAITTSGYILKALSKYFPVVVIIEDIHVLKGEMSFYALRHLQAIVEHVPMTMIFISRPSEEKYFKQFQELSVKEGCRKYEVKSLKYEDVERLLYSKEENERATNNEQRANELMHLSGGNALLLRELLRNDITLEKGGSITEKIIQSLYVELEKLPKKDRQVIAIAGMLGEEFSEQLLEEIAKSKDINCWQSSAIERLEQKGIIRRGKKILKPEGVSKEIALRVGVFSHALWWEAARSLYEKEKEWTYKKFAETIVPLLSYEDYPLLTDADLIVKLLQCSPRSNLLFLIGYTEGLCGFSTRWHFHSPEEYAFILAEVHKAILHLSSSNKWKFSKDEVSRMVSLLNAEDYLAQTKKRTMNVIQENNFLARKLVAPLIRQDKDAYKFFVGKFFFNINAQVRYYANTSAVRKTLLELKTLRALAPTVGRAESLRFLSAIADGVKAFECWYSSPSLAAKYFLSGIKKIMLNEDHTRNILPEYFWCISVLGADQTLVSNALSLMKNLQNIIRKSERASPLNIRLRRRTEMELHLKSGEIQEAITLSQSKESRGGIVWVQEGLDLRSALLLVYGYEMNLQKGTEELQKIFSEEYSWYDRERRFTLCGHAAFLLEQWDFFSQQWEMSEKIIFSSELIGIPALIEDRVLMCMLLNENQKQKEGISILKKMADQYPGMKKRIARSHEKLDPFILLQEKKLALSTKKFDKFLRSNRTLSAFDKAFYSQLYARIGIVSGFSVKEFSKHVLFALESFKKLGLPKRLISTAEKFAEVSLISHAELERIKKSIKTPHSSEFIYKNKNEIAEIPHETAAISDGIKLFTFGKIKAFDKAGGEIVSRWWGKRKTILSNHKIIVAELIRAKYENKILGRDELLKILFPAVRKENSRIVYKKNDLLSQCLRQLKKSFAPYQIFEKTDGGYRLHESVSADVLKIKGRMTAIKITMENYRPSSLWQLQKVLKLFQVGEFCEGYESPRLTPMRKELQALHAEARKLYTAISEKARL